VLGVPVKEMVGAGVVEVVPPLPESLLPELPLELEPELLDDPHPKTSESARMQILKKLKRPQDIPQFIKRDPPATAKILIVPAAKIRVLSTGVVPSSCSCWKKFVKVTAEGI
jgi:hypothetical protein